MTYQYNKPKLHKIIMWKKSLYKETRKRQKKKQKLTSTKNFPTPGRSREEKSSFETLEKSNKNDRGKQRKGPEGHNSSRSSL